MAEGFNQYNISGLTYLPKDTEENPYGRGPVVGASGLTPESIQQVWNVLGNAAGNVGGGGDRDPTIGELLAYDRISKGYRVEDGNQYPVDQYGWTSQADNSGLYNVWSGYQAPAGTETYPGFMGTPPPEQESSWGVLGKIGTALGKGIGDAMPYVAQVAPAAMGSAVAGPAGAAIGSGALNYALTKDVGKTLQAALTAAAASYAAGSTGAAGDTGAGMTSEWGTLQTPMTQGMEGYAPAMTSELGTYDMPTVNVPEAVERTPYFQQRLEQPIYSEGYDFTVDPELQSYDSFLRGEMPNLEEIYNTENFQMLKAPVSGEQAYLDTRLAKPVFSENYGFSVDPTLSPGYAAPQEPGFFDTLFSKAKSMDTKDWLKIGDTVSKAFNQSGGGTEMAGPAMDVTSEIFPGSSVSLDDAVTYMQRPGGWKKSKGLGGEDMFAPMYSDTGMALQKEIAGYGNQTYYK